MTGDPIAEAIARVGAGRSPYEDSYLFAQVAEEMPATVARAQDMVEADIGLSTPKTPRVVTVTRSEWATRNVASFEALLAPAQERLARGLQVGPFRRRGGEAAQRLIGGETALLLGVLARRVLGQYEMVLPSGDEGDTVAIVGANVLSLERRHQFRPESFRLWLALHETAHRLQFEGVPWMRDHMLGLMREMVEAARPEPRRLQRVGGEIAAALAGRRPLIGEAGLLGLFASPDQRDVIDKVQGAMSLLEGHGHVVMDRIGDRVLTGGRRMSEILKARRQDPRVAAFLRLTGLEMKMKQYELGEKFVLGVEAIAGWTALDAAWATPENLPTRAEIEDPQQWLRRVA